MKRKPSHICLIAIYVHRVCGKHTFTGRDLIEAADDAYTWYNDNIPDHVLTAVRNLKEDYGFTDDMWVDVMQASSSFYFLPTHQIDDCNRAIRNLFKRVHLIANPTNNENYLYAKTTNAFTRGQLELISTNPRTYRLNPTLLED